MAALTRLRQFGETNDSGFSIVWPTRDDKAKFSIVCHAHGRIGFGASAMGTIGIPFSKWSRVGVEDEGAVERFLQAWRAVVVELDRRGN